MVGLGPRRRKVLACFSRVAASQTLISDGSRARNAAVQPDHFDDDSEVDLTGDEVVDLTGEDEVLYVARDDDVADD